MNARASLGGLIGSRSPASVNPKSFIAGLRIKSGGLRGSLPFNPGPENVIFPTSAGFASYCLITLFRASTLDCLLLKHQTIRIRCSSFINIY